jgi:predicted PP-loop superfamily ATPase
MLTFCKKCVNPMGIGIINPLTAKELVFLEVDGGFVCEICRDVLDCGGSLLRQSMDREFGCFLDGSRKILFAYSGGLDSTVVLAKLVAECQKRRIALLTFTVNTAVKGTVAGRNIKNVLHHLGIERDHRFVDITTKLQDDPRIVGVTGHSMTTLDVYKKCLAMGVLPCGKICNAMMDCAYELVMRDLGFQAMVTGGDTPKKNSAGVYSLFWKKPSGITIVRGGYAFALSKRLNSAFVAEHGIPWTHPHCGGYDTDCLIPGVFFSDGFDGCAEQAAETVIAKYPIILDYLSERVRFGVIDREDGLKMLTHVDISSRESRQELVRIFNQTVS